MRSSLKLLPLVPMLTLASCGPSLHLAQPSSQPLTTVSPSNSPASSAIKPTAVPCSSLKHGQVSRSDTTATLVWLLPVLATIDQICGK